MYPVNFLSAGGVGGYGVRLASCCYFSHVSETLHDICGAKEYTLTTLHAKNVTSSMVYNA